MQQRLSVILDTGLTGKYKKYFLPLTVLIIACYMIFFLQFNGLYGQDSHAYLKYAKELKHFVLEGTETSSFFWPIFYPLLGAIVGIVGLPIAMMMQIISIAAFLGTLMQLRKIISLVYAKDATIYIFLGAATQVYFMRGGFLVMSDMLDCFFITTIVWKFLQWQKEKKIQFFVFILLLSFFAFTTRYPSIIVVGPMVVVCSMHYFKLLRFPLQLILGLLVLLIASFIVYLNNRFIIESLHIFHSWNFSNWFSVDLVGRDGVSSHTVPNVLYVFGNLFHIGYLSFGIGLIPFYNRLRMNSTLLLGLILYVLLLVGISTQNYRFLLIVHPIILFLLFPAFDGLWEWLTNKRLRVIFVLGVVVFNASFFIYSFSKTLTVYSTEREIVEALKQINSDAPIYSFYVDQSFTSYGIQNKVYNFYYEDYSDFESGALVVFNESQFKKQWKGHHVMNNWNRLKSNYELDTLKVVKSNWRIYRIK